MCRVRACDLRPCPDVMRLLDTCGMRDLQPAGVTAIDASGFANAGEVLSRAFHTDPLWVTVIRDSERRPEMLATMFTGLTKTTIASHGMAERTLLMEGVALWLPPGRDIGLWAMVRSGLAMPRFVRSLPKQDRKRMMAVLRQIGERRKTLMPEPHWYVSAVGVDPQHQGKGFGSALMRHGVSRADRGDTPIYLETEAEENVGFYQHLGFEVIEELMPEGLDAPMWLMARRQRSSPG